MIFALVSATRYLVAIAQLIHLHSADRAVHWVRDPVSNYGVGPAARLFRRYAHIGTVAAGLMAIAFFSSSSPAFPPAVFVSLGILVLARLGVVAVPTDAKGAAPSARGRLHLVLAIALIAATYNVVASATPLLGGTAMSPGLQICHDLVLGGLIAVVVTMIPPLKRWFGLAERIFLLSTMAWFVLAGVALALPAGGA